MVYQIKIDGMGYGLRHAKVTVCEDVTSKITILYKGRELDYQCHQKQKRTADVVSAKQLTHRIDHVKKRIPNPEHPWRRYPINPAKTVMVNVVWSNSYPQGPQQLS